MSLLRLTFNALVRFPYRLALMCLHLFLGIFICLVVFRFTSIDTKKQIVCWWLGWVCKIINLKITTIGTSTTHRPFCIVSNHTSWLDILVIGSQYPVSFLSKHEIKLWPVIGYLGTAANTLYIKRGSGSQNAIEQIHQHLSKQNNIVIFPEATTNNGIDLGKFYPRIFASVIHGEVYIQPIALKYPMPDAQHISAINPIVPLKNSPNFLISALRIIMAPKTPVTMFHADAFLPEPNSMRRAVSDRAYLSIANILNTPSTNHGK